MKLMNIYIVLLTVDGEAGGINKIIKVLIQQYYCISIKDTYDILTI